jgi:uncharacterized protein (DUF983 family)
MTCPRCNRIPISFLTFLLIGWIRFKCRYCSSQLTLKSPGDRFWGVLAVGIVAMGSIWFFVDYPYRAWGETATVVVFVSVAALTLCTAMYYTWKDCKVASSDQSEP